VAFDYENAQIVLPLDRFVMTWKDANVVDAARILEVRNCLEDAGSVTTSLESDAAISEVLNGLVMPDWRYGIWNAKYVAEFGIDGKSHWTVDQEGGEEAGDDPEAEIKKPGSPYSLARDKCYQAATFESVTRGIIDEKWNPFARESFESYTKAESDGRWADAVDDWGECVVRNGYIPASEGVVVDPSPFTSPEDAAKTVLAQAECSDELLTYKTLAEIEAEYQARVMEEHQAELNEIAKKCAAMVAEARELLSSAGLL
jgi:hypothetical protein